jgi:hypothetical protein
LQHIQHNIHIYLLHIVIWLYVPQLLLVFDRGFMIFFVPHSTYFQQYTATYNIRMEYHHIDKHASHTCQQHLKIASGSGFVPTCFLRQANNEVSKAGASNKRSEMEIGNAN